MTLTRTKETNIMNRDDRLAELAAMNDDELSAEFSTVFGDSIAAMKTDRASIIKTILDDQFPGSPTVILLWHCLGCCDPSDKAGHKTKGNSFIQQGVEVQEIVCIKCGRVTTCPVDDYQANLEYPEDLDA